MYYCTTATATAPAAACPCMNKYGFYVSLVACVLHHCIASGCVYRDPRYIYKASLYIQRRAVRCALCAVRCALCSVRCALRRTIQYGQGSFSPSAEARRRSPCKISRAPARRHPAPVCSHDAPPDAAVVIHGPGPTFAQRRKGANAQRRKGAKAQTRTTTPPAVSRGENRIFRRARWCRAASLQ